jgi:hypothetical protein
MNTPEDHEAISDLFISWIMYLHWNWI